jgi:hypothetical protein
LANPCFGTRSIVNPKAAIPSDDSPAGPPLRRAAASAFWARSGDIVLLLGLLVILFLLHVGIPGIVPTGAEAGNWLALAREVRGSDVMSANVTYPPLFPALIALLLTLGSPPMAALLGAALLAKASLMVAVYLTARTLGRIYAALAATLAATASAQMYSWGGYPQLLGMAFGLLAVFLIVRYIDTEDRRHLWLGLGLAAATLATHVLIGGLLAVAIGAATVLWLLVVGARKPVWGRGLKIGGAAVGMTALGALAAFFVWRGYGAEPTLNPPELSRLDSVSYVFRDAPWLWAAVIAGAVIVLALRYWPAHLAATFAVATAWLMTSGVFFLMTGEQSTLLISQIGLIVLAILGFDATRQHVVGPEPTPYTRRRPRSLRHRLLLILGISALSALVVAGLTTYVAAVHGYRLVDHEELSALDRLNAEAGSGDLAVAARGSRGMPIGSWVEGYAELPTYAGQNPPLHAFGEEREQAQIANDIFSGTLSDAEIIEKLRSIGADYLVVDRRGADWAFLGSQLAQSMRVVDDTSNLVIFETPADS